jgi:glycosyltransferase involved in cell wall biosynthesis
MKISCIVPAYNEAARISQVLHVLTRHPLIDEVIVIDDCSTDNTSTVVSGFPSIRLVRHEINKGKSKAIVTGLRESKNELVMFIDADLIGLTEQNITDLIMPVIHNESDISISLRKNSPSLWHLVGIDYISGERVLPKDLLLPHLDEIERLRAFGLETFMNKIIIKAKCRIKVVEWDNVESPFKYSKSGKKYSFFTAISSELPMMRDIFKTASPLAILVMIYRMRSMRVR